MTKKGVVPMLIKKKLEVGFEISDIKKALKERSIVVNQSNINKFIKIIQCGVVFKAKEDIYNEVPKDKETLLMYGLTFAKGVEQIE